MGPTPEILSSWRSWFTRTHQLRLLHSFWWSLSQRILDWLHYYCQISDYYHAKSVAPSHKRVHFSFCASTFHYKCIRKPTRARFTCSRLFYPGIVSFHCTSSYIVDFVMHLVKLVVVGAHVWAYEQIFGVRDVIESYM